MDVRKLDPAFLRFFWDLASLDTAKRVAATEGLVHFLSRAQSATPADSWKDGLAPETSYAVRRLVKGLASHRDAARPGFAIALTQVLQGVPSVRVSAVLDAAAETLHAPAKGSSGQEQRDALFGRVFALLAVCRSRRLAGERVETLCRVATELLASASRRAFLRELCTDGIVLTVEQAAPAFAGKLLAVLKPALSAEPLTPEAVVVALALEGSLGLDAGKFGGAWKAGAVLGEANAAAVGEALVASAVSEDAQMGPARLHRCWSHVVEHLCSPKGQQHLERFWAAVVEGTMASGSADCRWAAMQVLQMLLPRVDAAGASVLFSPNVVLGLMHSLTNSDLPLHKTAKAMARTIKATVAAKPEQAWPVVKALLKHGSFFFDRVANTKLVSDLAQLLRPEDGKEYLQMLYETFLRPAKRMQRHEGEDDTTFDARVRNNRAYCAAQISRVASGANMIAEAQQEVAEATKFLYFHAFFKVSAVAEEPAGELWARQASPEICEAVGRVCRDHIGALLWRLCTFSRSSIANPSQTRYSDKGLMEGGKTWLSQVMKFQQDLLARGNVETTFEFNEEARKPFKQAGASIAKINKQIEAATEPEQRERLGSLRTVIELISLLMFPVPQEAAGLLSDLCEFHKNFFVAESLADEAKEQGMLVLVDVLLACLAQHSHALRESVVSCFESFAPLMPPKGLDSLVDALVSDDALGNADEDMEEAGDDSEGSESGDDDGESGDDDDDSDDDSDDSEEEESDSEDEEDEEGDAKMEDAEEEEEEEDLDMDEHEEELKEFDRKVAAMLAANRAGKSESIGLLREHFRLKLARLIGVYVKAHASDSHLVSAIVPLLDATTKAMQRQPILAKRLEAIFCNNICATPKANAGDKVSLAHASLKTLIQRVRAKTTAEGSQHLLIAGIRFLVRSLSATKLQESAEPPAKKRKTTATEEGCGSLTVERLVEWVAPLINDVAKADAERKKSKKHSKKGSETPALKRARAVLVAVASSCPAAAATIVAGELEKKQGETADLVSLLHLAASTVKKVQDDSVAVATLCPTLGRAIARSLAPVNNSNGERKLVKPLECIKAARAIVLALSAALKDRQKLAKMIGAEQLLPSLKTLETQKNKSRLMSMFCGEIRAALTGEKAGEAAQPKKKQKQLKRLESFLEKKAKKDQLVAKEAEKKSKKSQNQKKVAKRAANLRQ